VSESIKQTAGAVTLITGMIKGDYSLVKAASSDYIAEPFRSKLIPGYNEIKFMASSSDAIAMNISGSGPTSFLFFFKTMAACRGVPTSKD
jgi:homoserine kinase